MKKSIKFLLAAAMSGYLAFATSALADDTDIYMANTDASYNPNILVLIDNSSNWAAANQNWPGGIKQGQAELNALRVATSGLAGNVNVGLMMFSSGAIDGAYIRFKVSTMWGVNRDALAEMIGTWNCPDGVITTGLTNSQTLQANSNCIYRNFASGTNNESINTASVDYSAAMFEVFKYFGGYSSPALALEELPGSPVDSTHFGTARYSTLDPRYDPRAYSPDTLRYWGPLSAANSCAQNYLVLIGNGYPTLMNDSPASLLTGVGGDATQQYAPDFTTVTGDVPTKLNSSPQAFASQEACELAAAATYGNAYNSYTCVSASTVTNTTTLGTSSCGQFADETACVAAASNLYPGHDSYSCATAASCSGVSTLGGAPSACGLYASAAECEAALPALYPGFTSLTCTASASTCTPSTVRLNYGWGNFYLGNFATAAECEAAAADIFPGYSSYTCTAKATAVTDLGTTSCYASQAECQTAVAALFPNYSAISCAAPIACNALATQCAASNAFNSTASCDAASATKFASSPYAPFSSYTCNSANDASCASGEKLWTFSGISGKSRYTASGTATSWYVDGTTAAGVRFDMTGAGGDTYTITSTTTQNLWDTYGNRTITTAFEKGTFSTVSENHADEWAKFLRETDVSSAPGQQTIRTYTIDVFKDHQDAEETKLLMSMARQGAGKYYTATNADAIKKALLEIFAEIQSVNSVFASSSLPVSVNTQGTYLNQVFMGMFRPKSDATPRWAGNLKQYKFRAFGGILRLADKMGDQAVSPTTGFITPCADSFWTTDTRFYWNYSGSDAKGNCKSQLTPAGNLSYFSDAPDGDIVEKGGVAQRLRGVTIDASYTSITVSTKYLTRYLLTCNGASATTCTSFTPFDSSNLTLTPTALGVPLATTTPEYQSSILDWVRGKDVDDERVNSYLKEVRPSIHGGVVHSQPAVVDYGGTTGVIAFYGSDDGVFHAVDGNQDDADGVELWGFIAPEFYSQQHRLRDNGKTTPRIDLPGVTVSVAPKDYGFDGGTGVFQKAGTVWIFPSMRRGGRGLYAFDVSDPASPLIKWRKGCFTKSTADDSKCSTGWASIGQTWSKPAIAYLKGYTNPVLIFGGGYDTCEDTNSQTRCTATPRKGANIWFVDANTGSIIALYPTNYSSPGDISLVTDDNGKVTYVYAADTGGYVYRINVGTFDGLTLPSTATGWSSNSTAAGITIAYLSEAGQTRKFINGPAVVPYGGFNAVLIGSGDREHPLIDSYACQNAGADGPGVTNQFYMLIDKPETYPGTPMLATDLVDVTASSSTTFDTVNGIFTNDSGATSTTGWKFDFHQCEQSVNKGLVIGGVAYFGTNQPATSTSACETNLGIARNYAVDFLTGNAERATRDSTLTGGGMPPSPVGGVVDLDGTKTPFCIGCDPDSQSEAGEVEINPVGSRLRTYWYIEND